MKCLFLLGGCVVYTCWCNKSGTFGSLMVVVHVSWYYRCISAKVPQESVPSPTLVNVVNLEENYTVVKISGDVE